MDEDTVDLLSDEAALNLPLEASTSAQIIPIPQVIFLVGSTNAMQAVFVSRSCCC